MMNMFRVFQGNSSKWRVLSNAVWLLTEKGFRLALGFLLTIWIARHLGAADFGVLNYCTALVGLLAFLPGLGLDTVVRRELMLHPEQVASVLSTVARLRLGAALLTGAILLVIVLVVNGSDMREQWLTLILGLTLMQPVLAVPELHFQVEGKVRYATMAFGAAALAAAALRLLLITSNASVVWFGLPAVGEIVVAWLGLGHFAGRQKLLWWNGGFSRERARELLTDSWPLLVSGAAVLVYLKIDQIMLRQMAGVAEVGIYSAAVRLSESLFFVPGALVIVLMPSWASAWRTGGADYRRYLQGIYDLQAFAAYAFALPMTLFATPLVTLLYGDAYVAAAKVLALHVWASLFVFMGMTRSQELNFERKNQLTLWTSLAGAACNVGLNWWWIPLYGATGAAVATVISYAVAIWGLAFLFRATRGSAWRQTKALLVPVLGWRYVLRRFESSISAQ